MAKKRVVFMGKGDLAIRCANWFHESPSYELAYIVPVIPEPGWTGSLCDWAKARGIPIVESGHYKDLPNVRDEDWHCDLAFSVFYDKIIKAWYIDKCGRVLNLHNGPLPRYRGVSPINWALKNGESSHGVTIHEITPGIDDGPIVSKVEYSIYPEFDEVRAVLARAVEFGWTLFSQTLPLLDQIVAAPQDESKALYYDSSRNGELGERRFFTKAESIRALQGDAQGH